MRVVWDGHLVWLLTNELHGSFGEVAAVGGLPVVVDFDEDTGPLLLHVHFNETLPRAVPPQKRTKDPIESNQMALEVARTNQNGLTSESEFVWQITQLNRPGFRRGVVY